MAITGSPHVLIQEEDLSSYVSADSVTTGAVVGGFEWGPVNYITKVTSEAELINYFGKPNDKNYKDWFTARNFLNYSSSLAVVRSVGGFSKNANDAGEDLIFDNYSNFEFDSRNVTNAKIVARYPGVKGNSIRVAILDKAGYLAEESKGDNEVKNILIQKKLINKNTVSDNYVMVGVWVDGVLQEYGTYSLEDGSTDTAGYGNYLFKHFNNNSNWIYLIKKNFDFSKPFQIDEQLKGGSDTDVNDDVYIQNKLDDKTSDETSEWYVYAQKNSYLKLWKSDDKNTITFSKMVQEKDNDALNYFSKLMEELETESKLEMLSAVKAGWDLFTNEETDEAEVQLLLQGGASIDVGNYIIDIAEDRMDCVACVSPMEYEVVNVKDPVASMTSETGSGSLYKKSSYAFMDGNYKYQYDQYNDIYRWLPLNGDVAGIMAQTDSDENPWMSPGGKQIKNCVKLAFHPSKAKRDIMFEYNINPVTNFRAEGNILWGDWTRVDNTSFNFVGVRRLFLHIERAIKEYARDIMWKQNDELTETMFVQTVEPFLRDVQGGRGIQEFKVYAGSSVTSKDEMDRGIFRAKILIKPVRSIRYVVLVFSAVRSDMSIEEIVQ